MFPHRFCSTQQQHALWRWRRSVVNYGIGVSQVKPSNCFRRLEKLVLPSIFDTSLSSLKMWNLQSYPTTVLNERVWHFRGSKHTLTPPTYFQGVRTTNPQDLRPWTVKKEDEHGLLAFEMRSSYRRVFAGKWQNHSINEDTVQQQQQETIVGSESRDPVLEKAPGVWTRLQDAWQPFAEDVDVWNDRQSGGPSRRWIYDIRVAVVYR